MKQLIFAIAIIVTFTTGLKSQHYVPFPTENINWNVYYVGTCEEKDPDTTLLRYAIHGDTTINEVVYKKLCLERGDITNPIIEAIGGIREKDKKIYYNGWTILSSTAEKEYLLYDFTKQIGDTIKHNPQGWFYSIILDIDSIMIDGTYRKRYKVDNRWYNQNPDYVVEGIGSVKNGLLGHISDLPTCGTHYWEFVCYSENNEVKYLNPSFNDCFPFNFLMGANHTKMITQIRIYPNPVIDEIKIENSTNKDLLLKVIDLNGRSILDQKLNDIKTIIKLNGRPGIYNILITNEIGQIMLNQKIIKQ
jgi:hypothetical protein